MQEIDEKIRSLILAERDLIIKPVAAFITFENQEGYERACNLKGKLNWKKKLIESKYQFLGHPFAMYEAKEPTNIKWENRDKTYTG